MDLRYRTSSKPLRTQRVTVSLDLSIGTVMVRGTEVNDPIVCATAKESYSSSLETYMKACSSKDYDMGKVI